MRINCKKTFLVGAVAAGLAAINAQAGLTHRYNFNDQTNPGKDYVGNLNATLMNGASWSTLNSVTGNGVYLFNSDGAGGLLTSGNTNGQYITLPTNVIAGAKSLTFESWTDLGDTISASAGTWSRIFDVGDPFFTAGSGHNFLTMSPHTGESTPNARIEFNMNGTGQTAEGTGPTLEGYHHVMSVIDCTNGFMELFVDGIKVAHAATTFNVTNISNKVFWLGRSEWSGDSYLYGYIDEFRIYDRALSGVEAAADFAAGPDAPNPNVTATIGALKTINLTDPGHILELHTATTAVTGDFNDGFTGLSLFNATGFTLTSSAPTIVSVDQGGNLKGLKPGTAIITASYGGKTGTLTVVVDTDSVPPTLAGANTLGYDKLVQVTFSKPVDPATAQNIANYSVNPTVTINRAVLDTNTMTVVTLYTSQFDLNSQFTLTVNGVKDTVFQPNTIQNATILFGSAPGAPLTRRLYFTTSGYVTDSLANGMANAGYPYSGGTVQSLANGLSDTAGGHGDNYFSVVSGWLIAPTSDTYHFGLACDDDSAIYVSPDDKEANLPATATLQAAGWSPAKHFLGDGGAETYTGANSINVQAGQKYFFRVVMRNGTGGDNFDVAWAPLSTPIVDSMASIPAAQLQPIYPAAVPLTVTTQPSDVLIGVNNDATFTVVVNSWPTYTGVQWYRNGVAITNNGNALSYTLPLVAIADSGSKFYAVVSNLVDTVTSSTATLTVNSDNVPPQLVSAIAGMQIGASATNVTVYFNERVSAATAGAKTNYTIPGLTVLSSTYNTNTLTNVVLTLSSPMTAGNAYVLTVNNVKDLAGNVIDPAHKTVTFHAAAYAVPGVFNINIYDNYTSGADAIISAFPTLTIGRTLTFADAGTTTAENGLTTGEQFAGVAQGLIQAPQTGTYTFFINSDDGGRFFLSTDSTPDNLSGELCGVGGWSAGLNNWTQSDYSRGTHSQQSGPIQLTAGQRYFYRATWAEGGGGDYLQLGWTTPTISAITLIPGSALVSPATIDLSSVTITTNPVSKATSEGVPVTFTAAGVGSSQYGSTLAYQWLKNGVAIPGANAASYTTALPGPFITDNGAGYSCVLTVPLLSKTTTVAVLTVTKDSVAPKLVSAGAFNASTSVGVRFSKAVDSITGLDITKYTMPGYVIQSATVRTNGNLDSIHGDMIVLIVDKPVAAGAKITVTGVKDLYGNTAATATVDVGIADLTFQDIVNSNDPLNLDPRFTGITEPSGSNSFRIMSGGSDIWGTADCFQFAYKTVSGDFDMRARVANIYQADFWSKSGLMVRETLTTNSVMVYQITTANGGQNSWAAGMRMTGSDGGTGGAADLPFVLGVTTRPPNPPYPNAWVRITREGNLITAWHSTNGVGWLRDATNDMSAANPPLPADLYAGIGVTSHNNTTNIYTVSDVYDFSIRPYAGTGSVVPPLSATMVGASVMISWDSVAGSGCTLYGATSATGPWSPVGTMNDDGTKASTVVTPSAMHFYQLAR